MRNYHHVIEGLTRQENLDYREDNKGLQPGGLHTNNLSYSPQWDLNTPYHAYMYIKMKCVCVLSHYDDVIMGAMASEITNLTMVYSTVYSDADQRKHQSSASLAIVRGIHRGPVNFPHKWPVTRKMFPFHDVIMVHWKMTQVSCVVISSESIVLIMYDKWVLPWGRVPFTCGLCTTSDDVIHWD